MSCITAEINLLNSEKKASIEKTEKFSVSADIVRKDIYVGLENTKRASIDANIYGPRISVLASIVPSSIRATISLICSTNVGRLYLEIEPEVLWVYPDFDNYNNVYSNTNWNVN